MSVEPCLECECQTAVVSAAMAAVAAASDAPVGRGGRCLIEGCGRGLPSVPALGVAPATPIACGGEALPNLRTHQQERRFIIFHNILGFSTTVKSTVDYDL